MARTGINRVLLHWLMYDPGGRRIVDQFDDGFINLARGFFDATNDAQRLVAAEGLAKIVLLRHDMDDFAELRREVRTMELMRTISYPRQTDHSAHSVYVFLLGIWLYAMSEQIRNTVGNRFHWSGDLLADFLFPWEFAGLLHDIGYIFAELASATPSSRRLVERLYQPARLTALLQPRDPSRGQDFLEFMSFIRRLKREAQWDDPVYSRSDFPDQILNELRKLPWLSRLDLDVDAFELFQQFKAATSIPADGLEIYAYSVAETGYDGHSRGEIDHAIASALFMLQWSSYWYWLANETLNVSPDWYRRYFCRYGQGGPRLFDYLPENLTRDIVPILYSVACHNIIATRPEGRRLLPLRLANDPIAYLSILCDELQKWDRFPAGRIYIQDLEGFAESSLASSDIRLTGGQVPRIQIRAHLDTRRRVCDALNERLADWQYIVRVG